MKYLKLLYCLLTVFFAYSCEKETILSTTTRSSSIIGLSNTVFTGITVNFAVINNETGLDSARVPLVNITMTTNQAAVMPNGDYIFHSIGPAPATAELHLYSRKRTPSTVRTYTTNSRTLINGLVYSPVTMKKYAVQADSVIEYDFDTIGLKLIKNKVFPNLRCGTSDFEKNSTVHATKPYMYIAGRNNLRRLDLNSGQYITISDNTQGRIYGLRYNLHDNLVYLLFSEGSNTTLVSLNPETNTFTPVLTIPDMTAVVSDNYSATIHCCKNQYIIAQSKFVYTIDIATKTSKRVQTPNIYQGMVWVQD